MFAAQEDPQPVVDEPQVEAEEAPQWGFDQPNTDNMESMDFPTDSFAPQDEAPADDLDDEERQHLEEVRI